MAVYELKVSLKYSLFFILKIHIYQLMYIASIFDLISIVPLFFNHHTVTAAPFSCDGQQKTAK